MSKITNIFVICTSLLILCSQTDNSSIGNPSSDSHNVAKTQYYIYSNNVLKVDFEEDENGDLVPNQSENADIVQKVLEFPNSVCINFIGTDTFWIDTSRNNINSSFKSRSSLPKRSVAYNVRVYPHPQYAGDVFLVTQSIPSFSAYNWDNQISSLTFQGIGLVLIYEHSNYGGHGLGFYNSSGPSNGTFYVPDLRDHCMKKVLWWCSKSWNDQISSLEF
ncbi:MAG TPA: hypothetical protein VHP36_04880 [Chitinispirillaceae bacterium]|nr:hypothetical protein [Chitinispirillaceae bacterium]